MTRMLNSADPIGREKYQHLIVAAQKEETIKVAVAHPCDDVSLRGAIEAQKLGLIAPILVAPPERVRKAAKDADLDIAAVEIVASAHSHDSAAKAVELVKAGRAEALMKGSLHTDELMGAVVAREGGIRTERRISHCFIMDVPDHEQALIITDAAVNIAPDLDAKPTSSRTRSISRMRWAPRRSESRCSAQWRLSRQRFPRRSTPPLCARWRTGVKSRARFWTDR